MTGTVLDASALVALCGGDWTASLRSQRRRTVKTMST
jgi:hypothetical protein